MRTLLLQLHRYCGLVSLAFLCVAAVTGCLLTLRGTIDRSLNPDLFAIPGGAATTPAIALAAVDRFAAANPGLQVTGFALRSEPGRSLALTASARPGAAPVETEEWFVDPADGTLVGTRSGDGGWDARHFVPSLAELHFNLMAGDFGRRLLGVIAGLWLVSGLAGLILTLPERGKFWRQWWRCWQFRRSSSTSRLLLDLHRASGLWLLPFLLLLAFTSVALNFWSEWYAPSVTRLVPLQRSLFDAEAPFPGGATPRLGFTQALPRLERLARDEDLAWPAATMLYLPEWNLYGAKFARGGQLNYEKLGPVDYYIDGNTGRYVHKVDPYDDSAGLVMLRMVYPLHSGEIAGGIGMAFVFLLGVVTFGQSLTGIYIWWKKRKSRVAQARAKRQRKTVEAT